MGSSFCLSARVEKGRNPFDKRFGLFPMREVAGLLDGLEPGSGDRLTPALAISGCDDAVLSTPKQQCRAVDPMQPALKPRIMHVGLPAIERECLQTADG